jgi:hypothetical protein
MSREGNEQIEGLPGAYVTQIVQSSCIENVSPSFVSATGTRTRLEVATLRLDTRLGKIFDPFDPLGGVRNIFTRRH